MPDLAFFYERLQHLEELLESAKGRDSPELRRGRVIALRARQALRYNHFDNAPRLYRYQLHDVCSAAKAIRKKETAP